AVVALAPRGETHQAAPIEAPLETARSAPAAAPVEKELAAAQPTAEREAKRVENEELNGKPDDLAATTAEEVAPAAPEKSPTQVEVFGKIGCLLPLSGAARELGERSLRG